MSNHEDFRTSATRTEDSLTGDATLTGEQGDRQPDPAAAKAKNKSNVKMASILGAIVLVVGGLGYMAFFKHASPAPAHGGLPPGLATPTPHPTPAPAVTPPVTTPVVAHPAPAASAAEAPKLASTTDAQALLGGTPDHPVAPPGTLPGTPPVGSAPSAILGATPAPAGSAASAIAPALNGALPGATPTPSPVMTPAASSTVAAPVTTPEATSPVTPSAQATSAPAAPVAQGALEDRVSHLEDRVTDLEKNQSHILEMLATQPEKAIKASQTTPTSSASNPSPGVKPKPKVHRQPTNQVEVITPKAKPVVTEKSVSVTKPTNTGCQLASIVPNRAWTKQSDGTFLTYGVGDTAPNGSVIKSIDPESGVITEKGKLICSLAD